MFLLTSPSATLTGLDYVGVVTERGTATLQFTLAAASLNGIVLTGSCSGGIEVRTAVPAADAATLATVTFDAVSIEMTYDGTAYVFDAGAPPDASFSFGSGTVTALGIEFTSMTSSKLVTHSSTTSVVSC